MKKVFFTLFLGVYTLFVHAQMQTPWATSFIDRQGNSVGKSIAIDNQKNMYVTGSFEGDIDFDPSGTIPSLSSGSVENMFLASYDSSGKYRWAFQLKGNFSDPSQGNSVCVDGSGNVYVTGYFKGSMDFDPDDQNSLYISSTSFTMDAFFAKYTSNGKLVWAKKIGESNDDEGNSIYADNTGIYLTGTYSSNFLYLDSLRTKSIFNNGQNDIFIAKYDLSGKYLWGGSLGGFNDDQGVEIVADGNTVYTTGMYSSGNFDFDFASPTTSTSYKGGTDVYLAAYNAADGSFLWVNAFGDTNNDIAKAVTLAPSGNVFITGGFVRTIHMDNNDFSKSLSTSSDSTDIYVIEYDRAGKYQQAFSISGFSRNVMANDIDITSSGNIQLTGYISETIDFDRNNPGGDVFVPSLNQAHTPFIAKYTSNGKFVNAAALQTGDQSEATSIAADGIGNVFLAGFVSGSGWLSASSAASKGFYNASGFDLFLGKYDMRLSQTINVPSHVSSLMYGWPPITLSALASSNLPVTYISDDPAVASITGDILNVKGVGSTMISYVQVGNEDYMYGKAAFGFRVYPADQTIAFSPLPKNKKYGDAPFTITATASSGLPVTLTSLTPSVVSITGNTVTIKGIGSATIRATQSGNTNYNPAPLIDSVLTIGVPDMHISGRDVVAQNTIQVYNLLPPVSGYIYNWNYTDKDVLIPDTVGANIAAFFNSNSGSGILRCMVYRPDNAYVTTVKLDITVNPSSGIILPEPNCTAVDSIATCSGSYISSFEIASLKNNNSGCSAGSYGDYTQSTLTTVLYLGDVYEAHLKLGNNSISNGNYYTGLWIDYNNNGSFNDPGEFLSSFYDQDTTADLKNLIISSNSDYAGARRLRIRVRTSGEFTDTTGCVQQGETSETEDYMIELRKHDELQAPSMITPNNDGKNDYFIIQALNSKVPNKLVVFDRMGNNKYTVENYDNKWDGKDGSGELLPKGTYYYIFSSGKSTIKGFFEMMY